MAVSIFRCLLSILDRFNIVYTRLSTTFHCLNSYFLGILRRKVVPGRLKPPNLKKLKWDFFGLLVCFSGHHSSTFCASKIRVARFRKFDTLVA